jgi:hypothetical protein
MWCISKKKKGSTLDSIFKEKYVAETRIWGKVGERQQASGQQLVSDGKRISMAHTTEESYNIIEAWASFGAHVHLCVASNDFWNHIRHAFG